MSMTVSAQVLLWLLSAFISLTLGVMIFVSLSFCKKKLTNSKQGWFRFTSQTRATENLALTQLVSVESRRGSIEFHQLWDLDKSQRESAVYIQPIASTKTVPSLPPTASTLSSTDTPFSPAMSSWSSECLEIDGLEDIPLDADEPGHDKKSRSSIHTVHVRPSKSGTLGVLVECETDIPVISQVLPASKHSWLANTFECGDEILSINGVDLFQKGYEDVIQVVSAANKECIEAETNIDFKIRRAS